VWGVVGEQEGGGQFLNTDLRKSSKIINSVKIVLRKCEKYVIVSKYRPVAYFGLIKGSFL
jgi:hypothetical protein